MKVSLISKTPNMLATMYTAAHTCYSDRKPEDIFNDGPVLTQKELDDIWTTAKTPQEFLVASEDLKDKKMLKTVRGCIARKHSSVMTHGNFTFAVSNVSRVLTHQIMRHHTGITFDQQSQRYVTMPDDFEWVLPEGLQKLYDSGMLRWIEYNDFGHTGYEFGYDVAMDLVDTLENIKKLYKKLMETGEHKEDARYILPNATPTNYVCTCNLTALFHLWNVRAKHSTGKAQKEIEDVVKAMVEEVCKSEPWLREFFV